MIPQTPETEINIIPLCIPLFITLGLSFHNIYKHLTNFHEPRLQLYIVRIVIMIPIISLQAFLCILFPNEALIFEALKGGYEAYVLYIFLQLLIQYIGGENIIISHLEAKGRMNHLWPYSKFLRPVNLNRNFFKNVKKGILQFVFVKPTTSFLAALMGSQNHYNGGILSPKSGFFYCAIINNISTSIALYSLVLFYLATKERLMQYNPFYKFLLIKSILFFSFWQSIVVSVLLKFEFFGDPHNPVNMFRAIYYQYCIILCEMVIAGIVFNLVFTYEDFYDWSKPAKPILTNLSKVLSMKDLITDAKVTFVDEEEEYETPLKEMTYEDGGSPLRSGVKMEDLIIPKNCNYEKYL